MSVLPSDPESVTNISRETSRATHRSLFSNLILHVQRPEQKEKVKYHAAVLGDAIKKGFKELTGNKSQEMTTMYVVCPEGITHDHAESICTCLQRKT